MEHCHYGESIKTGWPDKRRAPLATQGSICSELVRRLAEHGPSLARAVTLAAEADCLAALASVARERRFCRPALTQDNVLHIRQGAPGSALAGAATPARAAPCAGCGACRSRCWLG